ncbi:C13 family peptidase [Microvirga alba]|uniref:Peptidase C13, legumain asparaginyl peptidase n=1 Tax=Microvirga alba TaxID=2791025 RepID=A0A931FQ78_9HYPH|nr:C13 family peptidase [Microvirga alba]MBF9234307.1 peptidase C13, legumain asparaginyl peptidase [Microvirga alba]
MRRFVACVLVGLALSCGLSSEALAQKAGGAAAFTVEPHRPGKIDVYVLSFGLWGPQSVFESEAKGAARILEGQFGSKGRTIVRVNTKARSEATPASLLAASQAVGRALDPDEDVIMLVLTSHGAPQGLGLVSRREAHIVTPDDVRYLLGETKARHRVVIVSACYSGIFANALADERTLVITAAAEDKPSFGCRDGATWTYFGDAFFNKALRNERQLDVAFKKAHDLVTKREEREGFDPSHPQIAGGAPVLERLKAR